MRRVYPLLLLAALLALVASGCGATSKAGGATDPALAPPGSSAASFPQNEPAPSGSGEPSTSPSQKPSASASDTSDPVVKLKQTAHDVLDMLRDRDLERLAAAVDPEKGLRFSPYAHMDNNTAPVFKAGNFPSFKDTDKIKWGSIDGSGDNIELTFRDYFEKFVYDQDFASAPDVSVNKLVGEGNTPFNGKEIYPDASYVEFHFPGFDKNNKGMDWESLILMFRQVGEDWKLCAITHGQWTI